MISVLNGASKADIVRDPFPHLLMPDVLNPDVYDGLARQYPGPQILPGDMALSKNGKVSYSASKILADPRIGSPWREFVAYHVSGTFYREVIALFGDTIRSLHPDLEARIGKRLEDLDTNIRFAEDFRDIALECQFVYGAPVAPELSTIGPHIDREVALYAGLLYFRLDDDVSTGGDLELYRFESGRAYIRDGRLVPPARVSATRVIHYRRNTLVFFPHSPDAVHGVTPRRSAGLPRLHVNFVGELQSPIYSVDRYQTVAESECWGANLS